MNPRPIFSNRSENDPTNNSFNAHNFCMMQLLYTIKQSNKTITLKLILDFPTTSEALAYFPLTHNVTLSWLLQLNCYNLLVNQHATV
jgi:hypothetical protein